MTREPLPETIELTLGLDEADDDTALKRAVAKKLGVSAGDVPLARIARRVIDARKGHVRFHLQVSTTPPPDPETLGEPLPQQTDGKARVVIVGDGPCGLFAAWELARRGICSIVVDRGKTVNPRRLDLRTLNRPYLGTVNEDSNYCFGEGGAGSGCLGIPAAPASRWVRRASAVRLAAGRLVLAHPTLDRLAAQWGDGYWRRSVGRVAGTLQYDYATPTRLGAHP